MKTMRYVLIMLLLIAVAAPAQQQEVVEEVLVKINDQIITLSEFNNAYEPLVQRLQTIFSGEELEQEKQDYKKAIFNLLINKKLLRVRFQERGFSFGDDVYKTAFDYFMQQTQTSNLQELEAALEENNMTLDNVRNMAEENFIENVLFGREIVQQERPTESHIQEYYEQHAERYSTPAKVDVSQIAISFNEADRQIKKAVAEDVVKRARGGENFDEIYRNVTPGASATATANIGEVEVGSLRPELAEVVRDMESGEVSDVIELGSVYIVLKVNEKTPNQMIPLEEIRQQVAADIMLELQQEGIDRLIRQYKDDFFIDIKSEKFEELYDPESTRRTLELNK